MIRAMIKDSRPNRAAPIQRAQIKRAARTDPPKSPWTAALRASSYGAGPGIYFVFFSILFHRRRLFRTCHLGQDPAATSAQRPQTPGNQTEWNCSGGAAIVGRNQAARPLDANLMTVDSIAHHLFNAKVCRL